MEVDPSLTHIFLQERRRMATDFSKVSRKVIAAGLLDRIRQRNTTVDPNTGQVVPRPRPILDAIKNGGAELIKNFGGQFASALLPMLLELAKKYLGGLSGTASAGGDLEEMAAGIDAIAAQSAARAHSAGVVDDVLTPVFQKFGELVVAVLDTVDPAEALQFILELVNKLFHTDSED